ncbi:20583_t:CDS:1 [Entrophospora sp. SA101]|nr:14974_t:CDS:1 [Entrophospora sp. SA101]CAJ0753079.1 20583_t:CDS:1 [Entrophospora sp. SA101]CAJ0828616.1 13336_t:CDS:1 [Entrophospora sp. SA101]CAJ0905883.1 519_t:CDS:1 [Entrophospora sp. SA101]CAJ0907665.1 13530_t:CDS:1 [Entrophospora sp. SA101]
MSENQQNVKKIWNFGAGPAMIPQKVLEKVQLELLNYNNTGMSVMEISHRSKEFEDLLNTAKNNLIKLLNIPNNYRVLFMQGGGHTQFSAIVYNLLAAKSQNVSQSSVDEGEKEAFNPPLDYIITGSWSAKAFEEAKRLYNNVNVVIDAKKFNGSYGSIPSKEHWKLSGSKAAYVYYCDNETVNGVEFNHVPEVDPEVPLVCDMSSNILSRKIDVSKFGLIYAGSQKNIGPAGVTIVIVREDLLTKPKSITTQDTTNVPIVPTMLDYKTMADNNSLYNTPPVFAIYVANYVFEWLLENGGIDSIEKENAVKSSKLYNMITNSKIYQSPVEKSVRSRMNIPFRIDPPELENFFLDGAAQLGMVQLKGHRSVGGIRASIYNAMPLQGVEILIEYMIDFEKKNSK